MPLLYALRGIDFADYLKQDGHSRTYIKNNTWRYHFVLTKVIFKSIIFRGQSERSKYVKINLGRLDKILGNSKIQGRRRRFVTQVVEDLVRWKVLKKKFIKKDISDDQSAPVHQITVYLKIWNEMQALGWQLAPVEVPAGRLQRQALDDREPLSGVYLSIQRYLPDITIDLAAAQAFTKWALRTQLPLRTKRKSYSPVTKRVMDQTIHDCWGIALKLLEHGNYQVKAPAPRTGRHETPITSLPRELRPFLRIAGKPLVELDIRNSQILIFAHMLLQQYAMQVPDDVREFADLAQAGTFYDTVRELITQAGHTVNLELFKVDFFARVFFSSETVDYRWRQLFAVRFPTVSAAITSMKQEDYKKLSHQLMWKESDLIVRTIAARLYREGCTEFTTLHDAFYCPADQVDVIHSTIVEEYQKLGLRVPIRVNRLVEPTDYLKSNEDVMTV